MNGTAAANAPSWTVSVIVPTYNRAALLAQCLDSLRRQSQPPLEIIVVDDGSTDDTPEVASRHAASVRYLHQRNAGKAAALNLALPQVRGSHVWFFDDDDIALPNSIEVRLKALQRTPGADLVVSRFVWGTETTDGSIVAGEELKWPTFTEDDFYRRFLRSCFAHLNGALVRRERVAAIGPLRTDLRTSEDYEYTLRLSRGARIAICDAPTFIFRQHGGLRGRGQDRYDASERIRKFAEGDAEIGRALRGSHSLQEFAGFSPRHELEFPERLDALRSRLEVMAGKGLVAELAEDARLLVQAIGTTAGRLDPSIADAIANAMQERYLVFHLAADPERARASLAPLRQSAAGRHMLRIMARSVVGAARWQPLRIGERLRLIFLGLQLAWLAR